MKGAMRCPSERGSKSYQPRYQSHSGENRTLLWTDETTWDGYGPLGWIRSEQEGVNRATALNHFSNLVYNMEHYAYLKR